MPFALQDQKCRLTVERILAHPFMKPSLCSIPLRPLQQTEKTLPSGTATAANTKVLSDIGNGSSTTLRSVLQRMDPGLFVAAGESVVEQRKTPFGFVRVAKEKSEGRKPRTGLESLGTTEEQRLTWGSGLGTRGLVSVRQRIKGGKIELTRDGSVMLSIANSCIVIAPDGSRVDVLNTPPDGSLPIGEMYNCAAKWLERRRRKSTLAGFLLSPLRENGSSAVDHIAYCSVKGNGPLPDYEVRFAAVEMGQKGCERQIGEWNVEVQVLVQRAKGTVVVHARVQGGAQKGEASWKECAVPIKRVALDQERTRWVSAGTSQSSLVIADLSRREVTALERSLDASQAVDTVFATLCGSS